MLTNHGKENDRYQLKNLTHHHLTKDQTTDITEHIIKAKWKWAGHITQIKDNNWTTESTEWDKTKCITSVKRLKYHYRDDIVEK